MSEIIITLSNVALISLVSFFISTGNKHRFVILLATMC